MQFILVAILEALDQIFQLTTYVIRERSMAEDDDQRGTKFFVSPSSLPLFMEYISNWTEKVLYEIFQEKELFEHLLLVQKHVTSMLVQDYDSNAVQRNKLSLFYLRRHQQNWYK